jgi:hypothetical protein
MPVSVTPDVTALEQKHRDLIMLQRQVREIVQFIDDMPFMPGREAGGPEATIAKRKLQEAAYWLGDAARMCEATAEQARTARAAGE